MGDDEVVPMFASVSSSLNYFLNYYIEFFEHHWYHMTPEKYASILMAVLILGWYLMKSDLKRGGS